MSIKTRIGIALGTVLLLHVFTAVMGHIGLDRAHQESQTYENVNADTITVLGIDRTISELQRAVTMFMLTGHSSAAERVEELIQLAHDDLQAAIADATRDDVTESLVEMATRMRSYALNFGKVEVDRATREYLVRDSMVPTSDRVLETLTRIATDDTALAMPARTMSEHVLRAEASSLRYFNSPGRPGVDATLSHLANARRALDRLPNNAERRSLLNDVIEYEQAFLAAVQATQGYLHLVNVVLAGEAAELLHLSSAIRVASLDRRMALQQQMAADAQRFQTLCDVIAILTVLAGILTASLMTRAVLTPVLNITATLRRLARGESDAVIENLDRRDEIGAMAHAAEVFRLKNIETERLLDESRRMGSDLERRNSEMTEFVYTVSHDLKSPLVTIHGFAGTLRAEVAKGQFDEVEPIVERICRASSRMGRTLEDLLELSRLGVVVHEPAEVSLAELCETSRMNLDRELTDAGVDLVITDDLPVVFADEVRLLQVLQNLIQNAIKHGRPEQGTPIITIESEERDHETVIKVCDNGPGVEDRFHEKIFGIFQRLDAHAEGTGVGLAIVRKIAEAHGGRVWVESEPGRGATFCFSLPSLRSRARAA